MPLHIIVAYLWRNESYYGDREVTVRKQGGNFYDDFFWFQTFIELKCSCGQIILEPEITTTYSFASF